jgi:hypothetical protein
MDTMAKQLARCGIEIGRLDEALTRLVQVERPRYRRLWAYYRNPLRIEPDEPSRPYRQAQEWGLPARITGRRAGAEPFTGTPAEPQRKEVVIENDIGWRIETMVEYLFGKPLVIRSSAPDPQRRALLDALIQAILARNGGILFLQQLALFGAVHGFVDVLVKLEVSGDGVEVRRGQRLEAHPRTTFALGKAPAGCRPGGDRGLEEVCAQTAATAAPGAEREGTPAAPTAPTQASAAAALEGPDDWGPDTTPPEALIGRLARSIRLELVEPARAVPLLSPEDYRVLEAYVQHFDVPAPSTPAMPEAGAEPWWRRWLSAARAVLPPAATGTVTEIITPTMWQRYRDGRLEAQGPNALGEIPLAHIQNTPVPFAYAGQSDVEPLIPLQDELNTRLSDRAYRLAMQAFKMYLARGISNADELPVGPGRMWSTDNEQASIQVFGGDADAPSESAHIQDIREALDKTSGVSPIAAGAIKNRIGRLTSAAALRLTLISLLSRTDRKRTTYGAGIARMLELALRWLDVTGAFPTTPAEREVEIHWPSPLPENEAEKLAEAEAKLRLGIEREVVLRELGY